MRPCSLRLCCIAALVACAPLRAQVRDVELKAAYIYNFAQFTVWPDGARPREPFVVCANPDSVLWNSLASFNGKPVGARSWLLSDAAARLKASECNLLVLNRSAERAPAVPGMLVVRDGPGRGAAITLVDGDEHVRFDVDTGEAQRHGLRFSSKLLRLARTVL